MKLTAHYTSFAEYMAACDSDSSKRVAHYAEQERQAAEEAQQAKDAARYRWLRDGKSAYRGHCGSAPYVVDPRRSRLYAVENLRSKALDIAIDADMLHTKVKQLHESNEINERGLMPPGASWHDFDGPYVDALCKLAKEELSFTDAQFDAVMALEKQ